MFRRSIRVLAHQTDRTIVRDPRVVKRSKPASDSVLSSEKRVGNQLKHATPLIKQDEVPPRLPFEPAAQNQESFGSMMGSYALAGFGMGLGMILVRVLLGG